MGRDAPGQAQTACLRRPSRGRAGALWVARVCRANPADRGPGTGLRSRGAGFHNVPGCPLP
eukprot:6473292-Lingulodinium_polyedra.AAC.1